MITLNIASPAVYEAESVKTASGQNNQEKPPHGTQLEPIIITMPGKSAKSADPKKLHQYRSPCFYSSTDTKHTMGN
ncbi:hypothetical protein C1H46_036299 [Malus baccata]|uniref:Uncharacterized protein n=1 Tax=Malus baccata TaxID=106549 RepID=A0A540KVB8_MALBA|nr:hypothetical protein C1H46_036299 [Malus baccata]